MTRPSPGAEYLGYQFEVDGEIVEVLGSDRARADPKTTGNFITIRVPGGSQALRRTETVLVSLDGAPAVALRRPNLLGAILIKACAVATKRRGRFASDRQDLIRLLSLAEDPRALAAEGDLRRGARKWLLNIQKKLDFSGLGLTGLFSARGSGSRRAGLQAADLRQQRKRARLGAGELAPLRWSR